MSAEIEVTMERLAAKREALTQVEGRLGEVRDHLVDSEGADRAALLRQRLELVNERSVLADEVAILGERLDSVRIAEAEASVAAAEATYATAREVATAARLALCSAGDASRVFHNAANGRGRAGVPRLALDAQKADLAASEARLLVGSEAAHREQTRAQVERDRAKAALERLRCELAA